MNTLGQSGRYFINYGIESWLGDPDEETSYQFQIEGIVMFYQADGNDGVVCGRVRAHVLRAGDMIEHDQFDRDGWQDDEELDDIAKIVYTESGDWSDEVKMTWPGIKKMDVLVIDEILLERAHRRYGLGLEIADRTISMFGRGCGLVAISPWPTEVANRGDEDEARTAHRRIGKYSERLGFKIVPGTDVWARSLEHAIERDNN